MANIAKNERDSMNFKRKLDSFCGHKQSVDDEKEIKKSLPIIFFTIGYSPLPTISPPSATDPLPTIPSPSTIAPLPTNTVEFFFF
ncbi:hypothetical protein C1645_818958 [Glomus cerebriforme]|uniref:Uncharacterized protein n=1 Tax=Glomus cerebriforme TaxID=658196 RepID=A0A397T616_9GLOM|nr:hypothetical protein C1645_818958 [Glomus cerebriforme]